MLEEQNKNSPFYKDLAQEYNTVTSPEYIEAETSRRFNDLSRIDMVDYYNNFTDFEHKERLDKIENLRNDYVTRLDNHIENNVPRYLKRPEEPTEIKIDEVDLEENKKPKPPKKDAVAVDEVDVGLEVLKGLSQSDNQFVRSISESILAQNDFYNGMRKSITSTLAAVPQLIEDALTSADLESETLESFNDATKTAIDSSFKSSGKYTTEIGGKKVDVANASGQLLGHFALQGGVGKAVWNATRNYGMATKGLSLLTSEAALGAITTDKESGTILNLWYDRDESEMLYPALRLIHIDEDDSAFEARMKGALEAVVPIGMMGLASGTFKAGKGIVETGKKANKAIRAQQAAIVSKHINKNPDVLIDYANANMGKSFDEKDFKNKMTLDYLHKGYDYILDQMYNFAKDETGVLNISFGQKKPEIGRIKSDIAKRVAEKRDELNKLTPNELKGDRGKSIAKELSDLNKTNKNLEKFQSLYEKAVKKGKSPVELESAWEKIKIEMPKSIRKENISSFSDDMVQMKKRYDYMDDLRREDYSTFKAYQTIFNEKAIKDLTPDDIKSGQFLSTLNKEGADIDELSARMSSSKITADEAQNIKSKFYSNDDIKKVSLEELKKVGVEVLETYGWNVDVSKFGREDFLSIPEMVATNHVLMKSGLQEFAARSKAYAKAVGSKVSTSKKEMQVLALNMADAQNALHKLAHRSAQLRAEVGQGMRAFRSDMVSKVALQATDKKFATLNSSDPDFQVKFVEKLTTADPHELKRIARVMDDVSNLMKDGKLNDVDAIRELARSGARRKFINNMQKYMYNNMLMSVSTLGKNAVSLSNALFINNIKNLVQRLPLLGQGNSAYFGIAKDIDLSFQKQIMAASERSTNSTEASMNLMAASKFLSGFRKADGTIKSSKEIFKDSFSLGKSVLDPGSEKVGAAGYDIGPLKQEVDEFKELSGYNNFFGNKTDLDELALHQFKQNILGDAKEAVEAARGTKTFKEKLKEKAVKGIEWAIDKGAFTHSLPLRTMNAMDDAFKSKVVFEEMTLTAKRKVNQRLSEMANKDPDAFNKYMENVDENYVRDLKHYMNDLDNFEDALAESRNLSLTKQYGGVTGEDFSFGPTESFSAPLAQWTEAFRRFPILEFLHPFARISVNMADYMTQYLPGVKGLSLNRFNSNIRADLEAGGYRAAKAHAKAHIGNAIAGVAWYLAGEGVITGDPPRDKYARKAWTEAGIKANSFNLKDMSVPLDVLEPMGRYFSFIANVRSASMRALNNDDMSFIEKISVGLLDTSIAVGSIATPEVLSDIVSFVSNVKDGDSKTLGYYLSQKGSTAAAKLVPFSSAFRQFIKEDEKQRLVDYDVDGVSYLKTSINSLERIIGDKFEQQAEPLKNIFNDQVYYYQLPKQIIGDASDQSYVNQFLTLPGIKQLARPTQKRSEPIYEKLRELVLHLPEQNYKSRELAIPRLNRRLVVRNQSVYLNNKQYNELIGYSNGYLPNGKKFRAPLKDVLNALVKRKGFNDYDPLYQSMIIRNYIRSYQKTGRKIFKAKNKQFQEDIRKKLQN